MVFQYRPAIHCIGCFEAQLGWWNSAFYEAKDCKALAAGCLVQLLSDMQVLQALCTIIAVWHALFYYILPMILAVTQHVCVPTVWANSVMWRHKI